MTHPPFEPEPDPDDEGSLPGPQRPEEAILRRQLVADAELAHLVRTSGPKSTTYRTVAHVLDENLVGALLGPLRSGSLGMAIAGAIGIDLGFVAVTAENAALALEAAALSVCLFMNSHLLGMSWRPEDRRTLRASLELLGFVKYSEMHLTRMTNALTTDTTGHVPTLDQHLLDDLRRSRRYRRDLGHT
ncbi:hypothetical protein [Actinomycetospora flava]|uniref:Uncharacterized protein n=1 Tax=Actinomycetospora flava TaxID=3129232 RepID=A0ABU8MFK4_9PSEU